MKKRKSRISLFEFLQRGNFGPFIPRQDCSPEDVISMLGKPDNIEVHAKGKEDLPYETGDASLSPIIVAYGTIEFHFDSPSTLYTLFSDAPLNGPPIGGALKLTDAALLRFGRTMDEFLRLAKGHGLPILGEPAKQPHWSAWQIKTNGHITLHFENDDSEEMSYSKAVLRAFFWQPC